MKRNLDALKEGVPLVTGENPPKENVMFTCKECKNRIITDKFNTCHKCGLKDPSGPDRTSSFICSNYGENFYSFCIDCSKKFYALLEEEKIKLYKEFVKGDK